MNNVPAVGGARGIFDIFVPGLFLFLNLSLVVYLLPFVDNDTKDFISAVVKQEVLLLVIAIGFGYLIGVLLRLMQTQYPDKWSAKWLRRFHRYARKEDGDFKLWATEEFPYIGWMGEVCKLYLSLEAQQFYDKTWAPRKQAGHNRQFFNFCKVIINSVDEKSAGEINAAEALSRYVAAMFFAVALAFILIFVTVILRYFSGQATAGLVIILLVYLFTLIVILNYFRFMRVKEVEIVFAASFRNRLIFEKEIVESVTKKAA